MADHRGRAKAFAKYAQGVFLPFEDYKRIRDDLMLYKQKWHEAEETLQRLADVQGYYNPQLELNPSPRSQLSGLFREKRARSHPCLSNLWPIELK